MRYNIVNGSRDNFLVTRTDGRIIGSIENDRNMTVYYLIGDSRARYAADIPTAYHNLVNSFERNIAR